MSTPTSALASPDTGLLHRDAGRAVGTAGLGAHAWQHRRRARSRCPQRQRRIEPSRTGCAAGGCPVVAVIVALRRAPAGGFLPDFPCHCKAPLHRSSSSPEHATYWPAQRLVGDVRGHRHRAHPRTRPPTSLEDCCARSRPAAVAQWRPRCQCRAADPRRQLGQHAGAGRRRAHRCRHHRPGRVRRPEPGVHRAHRGAARPGLQPVRRRRRGWRGPDLHPARQAPHQRLAAMRAAGGLGGRELALAPSGRFGRRSIWRPAASGRAQHRCLGAAPGRPVRQPQPRSRWFSRRSAQAQLGWTPAAGHRLGLQAMDVVAEVRSTTAASSCRPAFAQDNTRRLPQPHRAAVAVAATTSALEPMPGARNLRAVGPAQRPDQRWPACRPLPHRASSESDAQLTWRPAPGQSVTVAVEPAARRRLASTSFVADVSRDNDALALAYAGSVR
jgi:hypothetical protein